MKLFAFIVLFLFMSACKKGENTLPYYNTPDFTPVWGKPQHSIAPFSFVNQDNQIITQRTFANKIYVADFFFTTCPGICPKLTKNMYLVQEAFKDNPAVLLLSHTVMPWVDSVAQLQQYALEKAVIPNKWHLVTGGQADLYKIARKSYFAEMETGFDKSPEEFLHTENLILVDKNRHIRGVYNGTLELETQQLIEDIRTLLQE
jgi:protein SCO1